MACLVGLPHREDVRGIIGDLIRVPETKGLGQSPERINLSYTEVREMTLEQILWYFDYVAQRRIRARVSQGR